MRRTVLQFFRDHYRIVTLLCGLGVLALLAFLYAAFYLHNRIPVPVTQTADLQTGSPAFMATLGSVTNSPVEQGSSVQVLNNGDQFAPDLLNEIAHASSTIDFSTYMWDSGSFSGEVLTALTDAARRGVTVRLILDGVSGHPSKTLLKHFTDAGGQLAVFHPVLRNPFAIDHRTHRRAIIIDGQTGYTGGISIAQSWLGNDLSKDQWRDDMFKVHGAMAQTLTNDFADQWLTLTGQVLAAEPQQAAALAPSQIAASGSTDTFVNIAGSAGNENQPISAAFLVTALSAKKSLYIANPYFFPNDALRSVLEEKAKSGVDVRILVPGPNTDNNFVRIAAQQYYAEMLKAGIKIYEYQPTLLHEKAVVVDGAFSLVGSANIDNRSAELNDEDLMGIADPALAQKLTADYMQDLTHSVQYTEESWSHRGILHRIASWLASVPLKQY